MKDNRTDHAYRGARILAELFRELRSQMVIGNSGKRVEEWCIRLLSMRYGAPYLQGYKGFQGQICVNRNETAAHGRPNGEPFAANDLITIDIVIDYMGWKADLAWTYGIEPLSEDRRLLLVTAWQASLLPLYVKDYQKRGEITSRLLKELLHTSCHRLCEGFAGHGIGRELHADPVIAYEPNLCRIPYGSVSEPFIFCWEPIITAGNGQVKMLADNSYITSDGGVTAQFEHMYTASDQSIEILNLTGNEIFSRQPTIFRATPPW